MELEHKIYKYGYGLHISRNNFYLFWHHHHREKHRETKGSPDMNSSMLPLMINNLMICMNDSGVLILTCRPWIWSLVVAIILLCRILECNIKGHVLLWCVNCDVNDLFISLPNKKNLFIILYLFKIKTIGPPFLTLGSSVFTI